MARLKKLDDLIARFSRRVPVRAGSLIVTLFGDTISQHGNSVWLGSVIRALEPLGLNARQIRTAVFRLVQEGWLSSRQAGRRSYYGLAESGIRQYERAARRIYAARRAPWNGVWTLVMPALADEAVREGLRRELRWQGYVQLSPGLFAHPAGDRTSLDETLQEQGVASQVIVLDARPGEAASAEALARLSRERWALDQSANRYQAFIDDFSAILDSVERLDDERCFQARTLLVHEYRRIILHEADLPEALLPASWPGDTALKLVADLYRALHRRAIAFVMQQMQSAEGLLPRPGASYSRRFGGI